MNRAEYTYIVNSENDRVYFGYVVFTFVYERYLRPRRDTSHGHGDEMDRHLGAHARDLPVGACVVLFVALPLLRGERPWGRVKLREATSLCPRVSVAVPTQSVSVICYHTLPYYRIWCLRFRRWASPSCTPCRRSRPSGRTTSPPSSAPFSRRPPCARRQPS